MGMRGLGKTGVSGTTPVVGGARQGVPAKTPYVVTSGWLNGGGGGVSEIMPHVDRERR